MEQLRNRRVQSAIAIYLRLAPPALGLFTLAVQLSKNRLFGASLMSVGIAEGLKPCNPSPANPLIAPPLI